MPLQITDVNVNEIINNSTQTIFSKFARDKNITLHLPDDSAEPVHVEADKDRLGQIVLNLVANAVNYTSDNGEIFINVEEHTSKILIWVRDTGMGIPEELDRLFERFYRVDQARSRHSGGTGLGLAIVKYLVESHGGNIFREKREGVGSTFTELPKTQG